MYALPLSVRRTFAVALTSQLSLTALALFGPLVVARQSPDAAVLPQSPSRLLAVFAAALTGPSIGIHSHNLFPLKTWGAALCVLTSASELTSQNQQRSRAACRPDRRGHRLDARRCAQARARARRRQAGRSHHRSGDHCQD